MNHLCSGCGVCAASCSRGRLNMQFSQTYGYYLPTGNWQQCGNSCGRCSAVCPFVPTNPTAEQLADRLFPSAQEMGSDPLLGRFLGCFEGYSQKHRASSASGGLASWLLERLLCDGEVDGVICVGPDSAAPTRFKFRICRNPEELRACSGSCYQPVEISAALRQLRAEPGRYALVALPCLARAIRLVAMADPSLRSSIRFVFGLVCGQMKSRHFLEYVSRRWYRREQLPERICFRYSSPGTATADYTFAAWFPGTDEPELARFSQGLATPFCDGSFNLEACDYCDDIFAETADVVFMDAWLEEYRNATLGTSLSLVRHPVLLRILQKGCDSTALILRPVEPERVLLSQIRVGVVRKKRLLNGCNRRAFRRREQLPEQRRLPSGPLDFFEAFLRRRIREVTTRRWVSTDGDLQHFEDATIFWRRSLRLLDRLKRLTERLTGWRQRCA